MEETKGRLVGMENSESGVSEVGVLDHKMALGESDSETCQLVTMDTADNDENAIEETFPDSDESEIRRRKFVHKRMADPLKKLIKSEIDDLVFFLEQDIPQAVHILSFIKVLLRWKSTKEMKREGFKYKILIAREECGPKYAFIVAYYNWRGQVKGSMYASTHFGVQVFKEALKYSRYFPIKGEGCEWCLYPIEVASEFTKYWAEMDNDGTYGPKYTAYPVHLYWLPKGDLMASQHLEVPREVKTQPLNSKFVETIDYFWGRHHEGSSNLVEAMVANNVSLGAFTFNDDFVAWAIQTHYGALDILFTIPKYRNKGIGRSLLLNLSLILEEKGFHPHAFSQRDNHTMTTFLKNSGFKFVNESIYFHVDPTLEPELFPKNIPEP